MNTQIEKEFKVLISENQFHQLTNVFFPNHEIINQKNIYFDTKNNTLSKNKIALRIRYIGDKKIVTIKFYENDNLIEMEKEVFCEDPFNQDFTVKETLKKINIIEPLYPCVTISTVRHIIKGEYAELCMDKNTYDDNSVDYEVEYEVKKIHNDLQTFQEILDTINIKFEKNCDSKLKRALEKQK